MRIQKVFLIFGWLSSKMLKCWPTWFRLVLQKCFFLLLFETWLASHAAAVRLIWLHNIRALLLMHCCRRCSIRVWVMNLCCGSSIISVNRASRHDFCVRVQLSSLRWWNWCIVSLYFGKFICYCRLVVYEDTLVFTRPTPRLSGSNKACFSPYVYPSVHRKFVWFKWNLLYMQITMPCDLIEGQGHETFRVRNVSIFSLPLQIFDMWPTSVSSDWTTLDWYATGIEECCFSWFIFVIVSRVYVVFSHTMSLFSSTCMM